MTFLKQLLILAFVPLTAWSGMPHLACRCSNGEVRLFCPRMNLQTNKQSSCGSVADRSEQKSCCGRNNGACCSSSSSGKGSSSQRPECCVTGCRCTPVYLANETGPTLKKVVLPELVQLDFIAASITEFRQPRIVRVDLGTLKIDRRVPDDLIVLCERWLI
ncbi:MAG: hypothetical protein JWP89_5734 [Schlesneria sp.]|nr:hypothetical protein [Schlesneria sp.]